MRGLVQLAGGLLLLFLAACATTSQQEPVPVEDRSMDGGDRQEPVAAAKGEDEETVHRAPDVGTPAGGSPVVLAMLDEADKKYRSGNLDATASLLERALTREPKNAYLWHRLAALRLEQKDWQQAYVLANKSNSLIRDNPSLTTDNWRIIAVARRQLGDADGANQAEREIQRLRGSKE
ncbi:MAG: tetratricopeptide repeat protein [Gammaproteobacteria bacterium]